MQTLHLVNPRSGRTDIDKSTLRQNPYLVDECYADLDSNTDRSSLGQNLYLVDRCSGDIDSNSALHIGHAVNINTSGIVRYIAEQGSLASKEAARGVISLAKSGVSSLLNAAAATDTTGTHSASAAATDTRKSRSESRPIEEKPGPPKEKPRSVSRPPKVKNEGPPKAKRSVSRPKQPKKKK